MNSLYIVPSTILFLLVIFAIFVLIAQTILVFFAFLKEFDPKKILYRLFEAGIDIHLLILNLEIITIYLQLMEGNVLYAQWFGIRWISILTIFIGIVIFTRNHSPYSVITVMFIIITLPCFDILHDNLYVLFLILSLLFLGVRAVILSIIEYRRLGHSITRLTFKESLDSFPEGLLFSQQNGRIILINKTMLNLGKMITGHYILNAKKFWIFLNHFQKNDQIKKIILGEQLLFRMPDGRSWAFSKDTIAVGDKAYAQIFAADMTEIDQIIQKLETDNYNIRQKRDTLLYIYDNLENIKREEEFNRIKHNVHDVFGYHISIIHQLLTTQDNTPLDLNKLDKFISNWMSEIREEDVVSPDKLLNSIISSFNHIGIIITVNGALPENNEYALLMYRIIKEATINAVRHSQATEIKVEISYETEYITMEISNNGVFSSEDINEGGGIGSMRYWLDEVNGSLTIITKPTFCIKAKIPIK